MNAHAHSFSAFEATAPTHELILGDDRMPATPAPERIVIHVTSSSPTWLVLAFALGLVVSVLLR